MTAQRTAATTGISTTGLLGVLFIGLKLTGVITWAWWLVLLPFYGLGAVSLAVLTLIYGAAGACWCLGWALERFTSAAYRLGKGRGGR